MYTNSTEITTELFQHFMQMTNQKLQSFTITPEGNIVVTKKTFDTNTGLALPDTTLSDIPIQTLIDDLADSQLRVSLITAFRTTIGL